MSMIEENYLQQLRSANLYVSAPYPPGHVLEYGIRIAKPKSTPGNSVQHFDSLCAGIQTDAPAVLLYPDGEGWIVLNQEHVPVLGPGDFENKWATLQEAVDDILAFYFGDPERMERIK